MQHTFGWPAVLPREIHKTLKKAAPLDPWFEVYEVSDGVLAIVEPFHFEETISFLVTGSERAVLIDTGMGVGDIRAEAERLTCLPITVINTHWHYDHIGGNYQFKDVWAYDNDFEVGKIERGMTVEEASPRMAPERICAPLPAGFDPRAYEIRRCTVTRRLKHLEQVDLGQRSLVIHHTPGHSPGGICLYDTRDRILFTGDTYYPGTMYANLERGDFEVFFSSMKYLASLVKDVSLLATAHNECKVPAAEILDALEGFEQISAGKARYTVSDWTRMYKFDRFLLEYPDRR